MSSPGPRLSHLGLLGRFRARWEREFLVMLLDPVGTCRPMLGMADPAVLSLFEPLPIGPAQEGEVQISPGESANLLHHRRPIALPFFELVGKEDDLRDHRHFAGAEGVIAHGRQRLFVGDVKAILKCGGGDRAVKQDRIGFIRRCYREAGFSRQPQLFIRRERSEEVVSPGRKLHAKGIKVISFGKVKGLNQYTLNVPNEAFRPGLEFRLDSRDLLPD